jgi:hypothetical protein
MTSFKMVCSNKLTRMELAKRLRIRADQLEGKNLEYTGELLVDAKGNAEGGVAMAYWEIKGLSK